MPKSPAWSTYLRNDQMPTSIQYASFLIRLWREHDPRVPASPAEWQGEVEHIQSGQKWRFARIEEALEFLQSHIGQMGKLPTHENENAK